MTVSREANYLQAFKANTKNCKFKGIIQNKYTNDLSLYFMIRLDYTWQDVNLYIPVNELNNAEDLNGKLNPLITALKNNNSYEHILHGYFYVYQNMDKTDKAKLRQLLVTKFEHVISLIADVDAILELHDNRNARPEIHKELNGLVTMGPFQITDFIAFTQSWSYSHLKDFDSFDSEPFTITTNYFGQDKATSRMLVTKDNGDTFIIKAGDFKPAWEYVERVEEKETTVDEVETSSMAFEL